MSMVISLVGEPKSGKTDWSLTAEPPIKHEEFDLGGYERAIWRHKKKEKEGLIKSQFFQIPGEDESDKHIAIQQIKGMLKSDFSQATKVTSPDLVGWKELWYVFLEQYVEDIQSKKYRTIVIDSATNLWPICHKALLQEKQEIARRGNKVRERLTQIEYGEANDRFLPIIQAAREMDVNLILVHHTTEERKDMMVTNPTTGALEYKEGIETGNSIPQGWRHTRKSIDLEIWFEMGRFSARDLDSSLNGTEGNVKVSSTKATIEVSGMHRDAVGMTFFDSDYSTIVSAMRMLRGEPIVAS